jgi:hypothetical protein
MYLVSQQWVETGAHLIGNLYLKNLSRAKDHPFG